MGRTAVRTTSVPDLVAALVLVTISVAVAVVSVGYGLEDERGRTGPGAFPLAAAIALGLLGMGLGVQAVRTDDTIRETRAETAEAAGADARPGRVTAATIATIVLAVTLLPVVGFAIASAALVFVALAVIERQQIPVATAVATTTGVSCWLLFERLLGVPLPGWSL